MMMVLYPTYTLRVVVQEPDPTPSGVTELSRGTFWDGIRDKGATGCDDVLAAVRDALKQSPIGNRVSIQLERFEERGRQF